LISLKEQKYIDRIAQLEHELSVLKKMIFGSKRERFIPDIIAGQGKLFEDDQIGSEPAEQTQQITYDRKKRKGIAKRKSLEVSMPAHLERVEQTIDPKQKGEDSKKIGEFITEILSYKPAELFIRKIIRPKYVTSSGEIIIAPMPDLPLPKANVDASVLAKMIIDKFADHLPFYRQLKIFKREGIVIAASTYNGWYRQVCELLEPLYETLVKHTVDTDYLKADESPIPVQTSDKKGATHKGYQWVYENPAKKIIAFQYHKSRAKEAPDKMLKGFKGALQTDGYAAYDHFEKDKKIKLLACMAHARRKFDEAKSNDKVRAEHVLLLIQRLYAIERNAKEKKMTEDQRYDLRKDEAIPVLEELHGYLLQQKDRVVPKSAIGKAIAYTLNLWHRLIRYTENGKYDIDNNSIENKIRPLALGRKNYLFAGSHESAQRTAMMYSFLSTCALNDVNPKQWLEQTINKIATHKANKLFELMPGYQV